MHGAGNDFIVFDNTDKKIKLNTDIIRTLSNRRRGIGGDGVIAVSMPEKRQADYDAVMEYYNSDGSRGEMCGNGLRCAAYFAYSYLKLADNMKVKTDVGILDAEIIGENKVKISISVLESFKKTEIEGKIVAYGDTGVPHAVVCVDNLAQYDVFNEGRKLRTNSFFPRGANANFVEIVDREKGRAKIRTYERGVEDETLACGTGICAAAVSLSEFYNFPEKIELETVGSDFLEVDLKVLNDEDKVYLSGPAQTVFHGTVEL
ncbi:MAG: diaminopimelate epimerase [Victivallales bacterium]|nr:diaminopimelate epimerase [Victivallales bacterium]